MRVFAISDLHLSLTAEKPMDIFGPVWDGYWEKIVDDWKSKVQDDDIVLIAGDISWAMKLEDAVCDIREIDKLPGKKNFHKGQSRLLVEKFDGNKDEFSKRLLCYSK